MKILLDTNVVLWAGTEPERLTDPVKAAIADATEVFISFASAWEYCAKRNARPHRLPIPFAVLIRSIEHTVLDCPFAMFHWAERLPPIHADPFDRMLIAHAIEYDLVLLTSDAKIRSYPDVKTLW